MAHKLQTRASHSTESPQRTTDKSGHTQDGSITWGYTPNLPLNLSCVTTTTTFWLWHFEFSFFLINPGKKSPLEAKFSYSQSNLTLSENFFSCWDNKKKDLWLQWVGSLLFYCSHILLTIDNRHLPYFIDRQTNTFTLLGQPCQCKILLTKGNLLKAPVGQCGLYCAPIRKHFP